MAESMKDYETELEASFKKIEEGDILTGTVISVDEKEVVVDLKYYAEGIIPAEDYSREPGFSLKEQVNVGDEVSATVVSKDDGNGNILLSRTEAADVLAWDKLKELKDSKEVIDVVVKGIVNGGVIAYVEGVRGFIPASKLALNYVEDTNEYLNKPIQVQVFDIDKEKGRLILSAKEILREKAEEERKTKISNVQVGLVTEGVVESLQPYGAFVDLGNGLSGLVHISQICEKRIKKPSEVLTVGDKVKVKVTAVKDGKLSLSIKEATDMMAKEIEEEVIELPDSKEEASTSLGALFANIKYIPKRAGQINEETEYVLNRFGMQPPGYLSNIGTQIKDMDIRMSPEADKSMSLKNAWDLMMEKSIVSLPIRDREGQLEGLITIGDIAKTYMDTTDSYLLSRAKTQYRRIAETIAGTVVEGNEHGYFTKGKVLVGTANPEMLKAYIEPDDLIIMGDREEDHLQAIAQNVSCIIVGMGIEVSEKVIKLAHEREIVIIMSPYDTFTIARLINQSIPVRYIMKTDNLVTFNTEDFTDDIQNEMIKHRHRAFPVINKKGKCIGTISRRNFLDMHRKKVALVDHNEKDQAVDNIDKAEIVEIIDHHKLGSLETMVPISFRNQPVGCTATILYEMYGEQKLEISPSIAGLLCAAIISDTLMFRSPTCTLSDKMAAGALALIAGINIEQFAKEMFKAGSNLKDKSPEEIFYQDYKKFIAEDEINFGVGQISSMDSDELAEIKERLVPFMVSECGRHGVTRVFFMLTNIIEESTELLYYGEGSEEMARIAFHMEPKDGVFDLKGVVSRKKQLIPALMEAAQAGQNDYN